MRHGHLIRWTPVWSLAAILLTAAGVMHCGNVPLTAPSGATLSITANPTAIPAFNGVSTITVLGFESFENGDGGPLPNGTQIFLTTNVGIIEERVEMQNGRALAYLRSNGRAGVATVEARSGPAGETVPSVEIDVGNTNNINIFLTANPATVTAPDFTTEITATVFDNSNNPLPAVPLIFRTDAGSLASAGSTLRTNAQGKASDRLTLEDETSASVTVFAGSDEASATLTIGRGAVVTPVINSVSPSAGLRGETLNVTITGLNFQPGASVSFGQGIRINSVGFVSSTQLQVSITIDPEARVETTGRTVTVTNPDGGSGSLPDAFIISTTMPAPRITSISPGSTASRDPTPQLVTINGFDFQSGAQVSFGPGIRILDNPAIFLSSTQLQVSIIVETIANGGPATGTAVDVSVINPDGGTAIAAGSFTVN